MKVLNLYAGIGGNRKLWPDVEVTAVEIVPEIAEIYQDNFPEDKMIIGDAHQFLLDHYREYDFIWSSPPCPTHSVTNSFLHAQGVIRYPDMSLYQEIIFLKTWCKSKWVVENVKSYYDPLYPPTEIDRHYFWANFHITPYRVNKKFNIANSRDSTRKDSGTYLKELQNLHGFNIDKVELLRNCVYPPLGLHVFNCALNTIQQPLTIFKQTNKTDRLN